MNIDNLILYILALAGLLMGLIIGYLWAKSKLVKKYNEDFQQWQTEKNNLERELLQYQNTVKEQQLTHDKILSELQKEFENQQHQLEKNNLNILTQKDKMIESLSSKLQNWEEKWAMAQEDFKQKEAMMRKEFELLAQRILEEKSKKFTELNQNNMQQILTPFQEAMKAFKEKVELNEKESYGRHQALKEQVAKTQPAIESRCAELN